MNAFAILFLLINAVALLALPRRFAPLPLLIGACYMTLGQGFSLGPFSFTVIRVLVAVGVIRVVARQERIAGGMCGLDWWTIAFAIWALMTSPFHEEGALIYRLGLVYNTCGIYFLLRIFCQSVDDVINLARITAFLLVPVALEMLNEKLTGRNMFSVLGGVPDFSSVREGRIRAQGPFAHSILAGTVGAVCFPIMLCLWRQYRRTAIIGLATCLLMVFASTSSGPLVSTMAGIFALVMWRYRHLTRKARIAAVIGYIFLDIVMKAPPYYLMGRIDLSGGSTGYHRAALIESSISHIREWWLIGTDYTRHWMPTGVSWSGNHTDITNHYLEMGVLGGLPLMLLFVASGWTAFKYVGLTLRLRSDSSNIDQLMIWSLGAALFSHALTCLSVSYFDQSYLFLYLTLAAIGSVWATTAASPVREPKAAPAPLSSETNLPPFWGRAGY